MATRRVLEIPLPEGADPVDDERELLAAACRTIVGLRYEGSHDWEAIKQRIEADGWSVHWRLGWIAEAKRGREFERAAGDSREEALRELEKLTQLDVVAGY
jgi:hypothetical protein